jgi:hypothetical protein
MALVTCPECGREISDQATACPGCGHPMAAGPTAETTSPPDRSSDQAAPGWYPDPSRERESRYWDGANWTDQVAEGGDAEQWRTGWWLVVGGGLISIGSFMPWVTASTVFGTLTRSGLDDGGDGIFTIIIGVAVALIGGLIVSGRADTRGTKPGVLFLLTIFVVVWVADFNDIRERIDFLDSEFAYGGIGMGMWVMVIGGIVALVGVFSLQTSAVAPDEALLVGENGSIGGG